MGLQTDINLNTSVGAGAGQVGMQMLDKGINGLTGAIDSYRDRVKNVAINKLMGVAPTAEQSPLQYQQQQQAALSGVEGMSPLQALNISNAQAAPFSAEQERVSNLEQLGLNNQFRADTLGETVRHNQAVEGKTTSKGYGMVSDDLGNFYQYNKDTGDYTLVQKAGAGGVNPSHVSLKPVTSRDSSGVETTNYVPFNKMTGQPINDANATATKYPVISGGDKSYRDDMPVIDANINNLEQMINDPSYASSFGQLDNAIDSSARWLGFQNEDSEKNAEIGALSSNLLAGFGKAQMAGVLTDQDMKIIKQQIPSASDSPQTAKKKLAFIKDLMSVRNKSWSDRLNQSNPGWLQESEPVEADNKPVALEDLLPLGDGTYRMPDGTIIRKKVQ